MIKRLVIICVIGALILCGIVLIMNSDYYYSKKLVKAIKAENIDEVIRILDHKPTCINTRPTFAPAVWISAMNQRSEYPLTEACITDNIELVKLLVKRGADVNGTNDFCPLSVTYTQKKDHWFEISSYLIENGASLDYVTYYSGGYSSILQDIVQIKPGANASDYIPENVDDVNSAFYYALEHLNHNNIEWMRVLQNSISNDRMQIVQYLLNEEYCDVNDTSLGMTALMFAVRDSTMEMVKLLLNYGANKNCVSSTGKTAYDYAVNADNDAMIALLDNYN